MGKKIYHGHVKIATVLFLSNKTIKKAGLFPRVSEAKLNAMKAFCREELKKGRSYVTMEPCDNRDITGACSGHDS